MNTRSSYYRESVLKKIRSANYLIFLDTETLGLKPDAKILQFAGVRYKLKRNLERNPESLVPLSRINQYICPEENIPVNIIEMTGLTNEFLSGYQSEHKAFPIIKGFLDQEGIVIGYNVEFDLSKIRYMYQRCGTTFHNVDYIDVLQMARDCIPKEEIPNYKLETVSRYLKCNSDITFHTAHEDVRATTLCFISLYGRYLKMADNKKKKEKIIVTGCDYWENPKRPSMKRIRIFSSAGRFYYDLIQKRYGANKDSDLNIEDVDLDDMEKQCLDRYHCQTIEELAGYLKRN